MTDEQPDPNGFATRTLRTVAESTEHLLHTVSALAPEALSEPSALPGWTRGHVLAHLARNADGLVNLLESARTGRDIPMYPSAAARTADIQQGAGRPLPEQLADLRASAERFAATAASLPAEAWAADVRHLSGYTFPAHQITWRRLGELEYHHVDLSAGYTPAHWPAAFAVTEFDKLTQRFADLTGIPVADLVCDDTTGRARLGVGEVELVIEGPVRALTAWLSGRSDGDGLQVHQDGAQVTDPRTALPKLPSMG